MAKLWEAEGTDPYSMQTLDDIRPGQTIGRYEFLVPIAKGGMAAVWAARLKGTRGFAKTVAIKTMLPTLSDDPLFEQMFLDEAQIAAQIHNPHVVEIMDLGEQDDVLYQVMEYVDGESLATVLRTARKKQKTFPIEIAVRIVTDACRGLHAAHELKSVDGTLMGLVHRDISPQNVMITYDGQVKLVDFGVAKAAGRTASETTAGQVKGKAPYMAPEQALGQRVDRRTDIFAMGIVLYQITTGKHPFRGENDIATLHNILHKDLPSPRFVDPKYPRPLEAVVNRALAREMDRRFSTAKEVADALSRVFPPTHRQVEVADVGDFVQELLGEAGNRRRAALAEAIKRADRRSQEHQAPSESSGGVLLPLAEIEADESSVKSSKALVAPTERINFEEIAGNGRASHPGLAPISDLAGRLSAPPTLDLDDDHRNAETVRPETLPPSPPAPPRESQPSIASGVSAVQADASGASNEGTPGTAPAAMVSIPEPIEQPRRGSGLKVALFIGGAVVVGVGIGATAWTLLRSGPADDPGAAAGAATASEVASPASATPPSTEAPKPNDPVYDLEAVSRPVEDTDAEAPGGETTSVAGGHVAPSRPPPEEPEPEDPPEEPAASADPATSAPPPPPTKTAPPESTWKPPPVSDPGF